MNLCVSNMNKMGYTCSANLLAKLIWINSLDTWKRDNQRYTQASACNKTESEENLKDN